MKQSFRRIMAGFLAVLTLFVSMATGVTNAMAASKKANIQFWDASAKNHGVISEFNSKHTGAVLYAVIDGHSAYCMNYGLAAKGGQLMNSSGSAKTKLSAKQEKLMAYCMYYGFSTTKTTAPSKSQRNKYLATQAMVWIIEKGLFGTTEGDSAAKKLCNTAPDSTESLDYYKSLKSKINAAYNAKRPSFASKTKSDAETYELKWNAENKRYEKKFTDSNKVLANFDLSIDGYSVKKEGNTLTVYTKSADTKAATGTFKSNIGAVETTSSCVFWLTGKSGDQEFISEQPQADPISAYMKVKTESLGYGEIIKTDEATGAKLAGAVYGIYSDKACTKQVGTMTTDENGYAKSEALPAGTYYVKEITAPEGYTISDKVYPLTVKSGKGSEVSVTDKAQEGALIIYKEGEALVGWDGNSFVYETRKLAGAVFKVTAGEDIQRADGSIAYKKGDVIAKELTSGANGEAVLANLGFGTYVITEVKSIDGYTLNKESQEVKIERKDKIVEVTSASTSIKNERQKVELSIEKKDGDTNTALAGAEFGLYAEKDIKNVDGTVIVEAGTLLETAVSDESGVVRFSKDYPFASYFAKETKAPAGYATSDEKVSFDVAYQGQDELIAKYTKELVNYPTTVEFSKVDITNEVELSGAKLTVLDKSGNVVDTWTSVAGEKHVIKKLVVGENYTLREELAPAGYLKATDITFMVEDTNKVQSVVMKDEVPTGTICINKNGEFLVDKTEVTDHWYDYIFNYFKKSLAGVTFEVYAREDIVSPSDLSKVCYKANDLVATIVTNEEGIAKVEKLPLGKYYLVETATIDGFVLDTTPIEAELAYADQNTQVVYANMEVTNERQKVKVSVMKKDADTKEPLEGAVFELYAKEDIIGVEGTLIVSGNQGIERVMTGKDGCATFESDLPLGQYYVKEVEAPAGYVRNDMTFEVDATYQGASVPVIECSAEFLNHPTKVELSKTDITGEKELGGASLSVLDESGTVIESWVSEAGKSHLIERLPFGKYILCEETAPYGYKIAKDLEFEVTETEEIQKVSMTDDYVFGKIMVEKTDAESKEVIAGVEFEIRDKDGVVIETIVTDKEGKAESKELPICVFDEVGNYKENIHYYVVETKAAEGYILDDTAHEVVLSYEDNAPEIVTYKLDVTNEKKPKRERKPKKERLPQTGDNFNPWLWTGIGTGALVLGIVTALWKKKEDYFV